VGRLFCFGFPGKGVTPWMKECADKHFVRSWILFARNASEAVQVWELTRAMRHQGTLWMIDHEGGRVVRLPPPVTRFPALGILGSVGSPDMVHQAHLFAAKELAALGFHINLAPVLDLRTNDTNPVVGDRSFSPNPSSVSKLGVAAINGITEAGLIPCAKHFPGHGDTPVDSHKALPVVTTPLETIKSRELLPFKAAIGAHVPMVMMGHLLVKALDPNLPASLSPAHIDGLLRKELGFNGVVITDDLEMSGITSGYSIEERVLLALKAGTDMLLVCHQQDQQLRAIEAVIKAVEGRIIKPERLLQSVARIEELVRLSAHARSAANAAELSSILGHPDHQSLAACFS